MVVSAMAVTPSSPRDVVQAAVTRVVAVLQNDFEASPLDRPRTEMRRAEIRRIAAELFDFDEMARRTLTRHWNTRTPEEQAEFVRLFTDLLERSYDVLVDGVSFVATFRSAFGRIIQQSSYAGLVDKLRRRAVQTDLERTATAR